MKIKKLLSFLLCLALVATALFCLIAYNQPDNPDNPDTPDNPPVEENKPIDPLEVHGVKNLTSNSLYVKKVDGLADDFVMGMDASAVLSLEASGVKYYNFEGKEEDVFKVLADNGVNTIRVRVWNNPFDANGNGYGGGNCDINTALEIGKRANKYGMNLMLDFHYSDFWADPSKQMVPKAWKGLEPDEKAEELYKYTTECLELLKKEKIHVSMVQIGNETNGFFCGEKTWANMEPLFNAGAKAVREVYPKALIVLHFANPEKVSNYRDYAEKLKTWEVDYDVFASSYYPYWHGSLENLSSLLSEIATTYNKKVMVAETSYAFTTDNSDGFGNTVDAGAGIVKAYPFTVQGQANSIRNIIDTVAHTTNGIGICYWEGTWIGVGEDYEANKALWEKYGSGWAASYANEYDPNDAGKYYGGCAVDNQAMFDKHGKPLESLKIFALAHNGSTVENKADALEDLNMICDLNGTIRLPETVNAVMLDDSKQQLPVTWNITQADYDTMYNGGAAKYDVTGTAGGMTVHCFISMIEKNFLNNYSFEDDANKVVQPSGGWVVTNHETSTNELWIEDKVTDSLTGTKHYHFWADKTKKINFDLEQEITGLEAGLYKFSIAIMGGDATSFNIYAFVKINDEIVYTDNLVMTKWQEWDTALITGITYNGTDKIVVGIHVECSATSSGSGAWGKIDDALFNSMKAE